MSKKLDQLRAVADKARRAVWDEEEKIRAAENAGLAGKCFVYSNSYGLGERWPMYSKVLKDGVNITLETFQTIPTGEFRFEFKNVLMHLHEGYSPITSKLYRKELAKALAKLSKALERP